MARTLLEGRPVGRRARATTGWPVRARCRASSRPHTRSRRSLPAASSRSLAPQRQGSAPSGVTLTAPPRRSPSGCRYGPHTSRASASSSPGCVGRRRGNRRSDRLRRSWKNPEIRAGSPEGERLGGGTAGGQPHDGVGALGGGAQHGPPQPPEPREAGLQARRVDPPRVHGEAGHPGARRSDAPRRWASTTWARLARA